MRIRAECRKLPTNVVEDCESNQSERRENERDYQKVQGISVGHTVRDSYNAMHECQCCNAKAAGNVRL